MEAIISNPFGCVNTLLSLLLIYFHLINLLLLLSYGIISTSLSTDFGGNIMEYTGSLDDLAGINAYLMEVNIWIETIKVKHGIV
jgi:hypothetical protein